MKRDGLSGILTNRLRQLDLVPFQILQDRPQSPRRGRGCTELLRSKFQELIGGGAHICHLESDPEVLGRRVLGGRGIDFENQSVVLAGEMLRAGAVAVFLEAQAECGVESSEPIRIGGAQDDQIEPSFHPLDSIGGLVIKQALRERKMSDRKRAERDRLKRSGNPEGTRGGADQCLTHVMKWESATVIDRRYIF